MSLEAENHTQLFPLLELPLLVLEKVISYISSPFDLKALRRTCKTTRDAISRTPTCLLHLQVVPKDLKDLEALVKNESHLKWNNFRFPPELYYVGCRRQYVQTFNKLLNDFVEEYAQHIEIMEMDRFDWNNSGHVNLLRKCGKLRVLKMDAMILKGLGEPQLNEFLEDAKIQNVLGNLQELDVIAFEFLEHSYKFEFMGKLLEKCANLRQVGSWGYFPEWEHPVGGRTHLKYFVWPLLNYLRKREKIVELMMDGVETYEDFVELELQFLNEAMDWQAGKWVIDLRKDLKEVDCSGLEAFLYSRIKSYTHRAVGWFDEVEFRKCGLNLMKNLTVVHIHNARDINLEENLSWTKPLFPKLESLTLIAGNRLSLDEEALPLEKVVVDMLLNEHRSSVTQLKLDIDLDHHHEFGSINLPLVIRNFPNLTSFCVEEWGPEDKQLLAIYEAFPKLEVLMFCGRNISDLGILGRMEGEQKGDKRGQIGIRKLSALQVLKIFSVRLPPKNVFPWPIKENNCITDLSFKKGFSQLPLRKFHFLLKSERITVAGIKSLVNAPFSTTAVEYLMNWLPKGIENATCFQQLSETFKFLDRQTFLEPANFVIPDIGKWVL